MYSQIQYTNQAYNLPDALKFLNEPDEPEEIVVDRNQEIDQPILSIQIDEFDPAIKIGRDNKLFLKRKYIERLRKEARYTEEELNELKDLYASSAEVAKGLNLDRFKEFISSLYNIENHLLLKRMFNYFDKNQDGIVEYLEVVRSLDIIEKGNFNEKAEFCFSIYDGDGLGYLDSYTITELFKVCYTNIISKLEQCLMKFQKTGYQNPGGLTWEEFSDPVNGIIGAMSEYVPTVLDRYDYKRTMIECLQKEHGFNLDKLEKFWKIFKVGKLAGNDSHARSHYANQLNIPGPDHLTANQFKLVMYDVFKINSPTLLEQIFIAIDQNKEGCLKANDIVSDMLFFLRGRFENKMLLFFEVNALNNGKNFIIPKTMLTKFLDSLISFYQGLHQSAREISNHMRSPKDGKIYYEDFFNFCSEFPSAMDFITRITLGEHPSPEAISDYGVQDQETLYKVASDETFTEFIPNIDTNDLYQQNKLPSKRWLPRNIKNDF